MAIFLNPMISLLFFVFLTQSTLSLCFLNRHHGTLCIKSEKQALLNLKKDLEDPSNRLSSWVVEDEECCGWAGIVCDNVTGHVKELRLAGPEDILYYNGSKALKGKINPSLLDLKYLTHLDLSENLFTGKIPSFIGSLVNLRYLNLTGEFEGTIPHQLGNLSSLRRLGLKGGYESDLYAKNLHWVSRLSSLEYLDVRSVNLSEASDHWLTAINTLPSLLLLRLSDCQLRGHIHFPSPFNLTSLETLDLGSNNFEGPIPCGFQKNMSLLKYLDWSYNTFSSTIPNCLYSISSLEHLYLDGCGLQGIISTAIGNMSSIVSLSFLRNALEGEIPTSVGNLCNLEKIDLSYNKYKGELSEAIDSLSGCLSTRLKSLSLSGNLFTGQITDQIRQFKNLVSLDLANNKIFGPISQSIGKLSMLESLDISSNRLEGVVSEVHFANLTNLLTFDAAGNSLVLRVSPYWIPPFDLHQINLRSWNVGPQFPMWLKLQKHISTVDLSYTGISVAIPSWFWNLPSLVAFDLSNNQLYGEIPDLHVRPLEEIYLSSNKIKGPLPRISSNIGVLDLSNNSLSGGISNFLCDLNRDFRRLWVLNLRGNLLSGMIPDCWMYWPALMFVDLASNNLTGEIPSSMGSLKGLDSLHLRDNSLTGEIPMSLQNCSNLGVIDLGLNKFIGSIPKWIGSLDLGILVLRSNKFAGHIPVELCALNQLQILDVADNNLSGTIPKCLKNLTLLLTTNSPGSYIVSGFGSLDHHIKESRENAILVTKGRENQYDTILYLMNGLDLSSNNLSGEIPEELTTLQGLISLNLSRNQLTGSIPDKIGNMTMVESLDLSWNQLSGKIPPSMSNLNFLDYLNLSYNSLSGEIPKSTQLQTLDASGFIGNKLCGPPLPNNCQEDPKTTPATVDDEGGRNEGDGDEEEHWFRLGIAVGFVVGFLGVISPLFWGFYRRAYFWFFQEYLWYKILDCFIKVKYMVRN